MSFSMKLPTSKSTKKQYGLILPASKKDAKPAFNAFAAAAASAAPASTNDTSAARRRQVGDDAARSVHVQQVERTHQQALEQDPSVFDYDGVYDTITSERQSKVSARQAQREAEKKQPKYIATLMEKAKIREIENERIRERRLLNERKAEDALYAGKEKLISASYKRKLLEKEKWDDEDARLDALEDAEDVTKRGEHAMAGFYANLLSKNIAMGGSTANARSAYTVRDAPSSRSTTDANDVSKPSEPSLKRPRHDGSNDGDDAPSDSVATAPSAARPAPVATRAPAPVAAAPKPSKADAIAAAKARFLARKALREQQQSTAT